MVRVLLASAALLFSASAASAQGNGVQPEQVPTVAPATAVANPETQRNHRQSTTGDPNRRVCRSEIATGSRLGKSKVCKTAREWDEQRMASKADLDRIQSRQGLTAN